MFLLPKGNPLAENVPVAKLQLPEALDKLRNGTLTGCATFDFPGADCVLLYDGGKLISAIVHREHKELKDQAALQALVDLMVLASSGSFNVYAFPREMALALLGLLSGTAVITAQEIKQIDFKALLERIKTEQMTGTLTITTPERTGLIFYKGGGTIGFFHDAATAVETSAGAVQQIAGLPGAMAELRIIQNDQAFTLDLAAMVDIRKLWETASGNIFAPASPAAPPGAAATIPAATVAPPVASAGANEVETAISELAGQFIGRLGKTLVEKELMNAGGVKALQDEAVLKNFLDAVERGSKLLASANKIKEMADAITAKVAQL